MVDWKKGVNMVIHIGDGVSIFERDILAIIDKKSVESSKENQSFINNIISTGYLMNTVDKIESYIIATEGARRVRDNKSIRLYVSNISSTSLCNRQDLGRRETNG